MPKIKQPKKEEIYLLTKHGTRNVKADKVEFKGFEEFNFYVHKSIEREESLAGAFTVSEKSTGMALPFENRFGPANTKDEAIEFSDKFLNHHGLEVVKSVIQAGIEKFGIKNQ